MFDSAVQYSPLHSTSADLKTCFETVMTPVGCPSTGTNYLKLTTEAVEPGWDSLGVLSAIVFLHCLKSSYHRRETQPDWCKAL